MIGKLVSWSVKHSRTVVAATVGVALVAGYEGSKLELDALPDVTTNQVLVLTRAPGLTPEEVERLVTRPVEAVLGGVPGLTTQRSLSRYGISSITAVFEDAMPPALARQLVQEKLNTVASAMPVGAGPPELGPLTGGLGEIFHFTLSSERRTPAELLELATWKVSPVLRSVSGVVEVNTWGGEQRVLEVLADPVRLAARGLTLQQLKAGLEQATGSAPGASVPAGAAQTLLRAVAWPRSPSELGAAVVADARDHSPLVRVADVAEVRPSAQPRIGAASANGRGETVYVMVQMLRGANALEVTQRIHARLVDVRRLLPADVRLDVVYDRSVLVQATLRTVAKNLAEGGLLVVAVLLALLGSLRAGLVVASVIPLSMLGAAALMVLFDVPGNLMSLGAIDFGLLVDGAVVMIENVFHRLGPHGTDPMKQGESWKVRVGSVSAGVARPVFFSVLVIMLVYVPVLTLTGVDGKMFRPMALTVVFALATSLVLALTFVPAAAALALRERDVPRKPPLLVRLHDAAYRPLLSFATQHRWLVATFTAGALATGVVLFVRSGVEFAPQLDEGDLVIQTTRAPDVSLETAVREGGRFERAVARVPEVTQVVSRIGSPAVATDIMGLEQADVFVGLKPRGQWRPGLEREALIHEIEASIEREAPGSEPSFTQPIQMRFNELLGGVVTDVAVSVFGDDLGKLREVAEAVRDAMQGVPGAEDVRVLAPPAVSLLEVRPRPIDASELGFRATEVLDAVRAVATGVEVGVTWDGPQRVPILLRLAHPPDAFTLASMPLPTAAGGLVPLSRLADVQHAQAPSLVSHHEAERRLVVGFNVRGADLGGVVREAQARVAAKVALPGGYRLDWGGQYETLEAAAARLRVVIPAVLVLILGVLALAFASVRPALLLFAHVPFACVGGMVALALRGLPLSVSAAVGFIALSGIAVLNGVVLMTQLLRNEKLGMAPAEAAVEAARSRVRPVVMTALVAALGFVPMMLAHGVGAEVQRPLATVVVGGLVTSTLLTLAILPSLYPWFARRRSAT